MLLHDQTVDRGVAGYWGGVARPQAPSPHAPSWIARIAARVRSHVLDRALIEGADPTVSAQLAAHAARITTGASRSELAEFLERLARSEHEPRTFARVRPHRDAVRANATELHALAALLRGPSPVYPRGVALLRALVSDGTGPAYTDRDGSVLARELGSARAAVLG
jgi:hypothetical protein